MMSTRDNPAPAARRVGPDRRVLAGAVAVLLLVIAAVAYATWDRDPGWSPTLREYPLGQRPPAPEIAGETLDGGRLALADLRGDVVVINIWASWCVACRGETADLEVVHQATRELGVSFVGLNIRDSRDKAISFLRGRVTYPSIFDPASVNALAFTDPPPPLGPPATLVVDRNGDVAAAIYRVVGPVELEAVVTRIAAEAPVNG
jgi:thiol-disulfide isomerase/thioredoxin